MRQPTDQEKETYVLLYENNPLILYRRLLEVTDELVKNREIIQMVEQRLKEMSEGSHVTEVWDIASHTLREIRDMQGWKIGRK